MSKFRQMIIIASLIFIAALSTGCAAPQSRATEGINQDVRREMLTQRNRMNQNERLGIYYDTTGGKAGFHFVSQSRSTCPVPWTSDNPVLISGYFPPGLRLDGHNIVGTPEQPGNWLVKLGFKSINCQGRSYPDEEVTVYFNIQGDAPRALE